MKLKMIVCTGVLLLSGASAAWSQILLVPDWSGDRVLAFSAEDGALINANFIVENVGGANFDSPKEAFQVGREIWVTDQILDHIERFSQTGGAYLGRVSGGLDNIRGGAFANGLVYVSNAGTGNGAPGNAVVMFLPDGTPAGSFAYSGSPFDVFLHNGELLVPDSSGDDIVRYSFAGANLGVFAASDGVSGIDFPQQITRRASGNLLAAGFSPPAGIYEFSAAGVQLNYWTPNATGPRGAYELNNGLILFTDGAGVYTFNVANGQTTLVIASVNAQYIDAICPGDVDGDGSTGSADLGTLLGAWESSNAGDLDGDSLTGSSDLGILLGGWGCQAR